MKEGRSKLEESAIIVQEVAKELKVKEEKMNEIESKLLLTLSVVDEKINEPDFASRELVKLADVSKH